MAIVQVEPNEPAYDQPEKIPWNDMVNVMDVAQTDENDDVNEARCQILQRHPE